MALTNEPIVILGAFRSGTSCLATALANLGVFLGDEKHFLAADEFNEGGYYELEEMQMLNARCLASFGMNYFQADRLPPDWQEMPWSPEMIRGIRSLLKTHFSGKERWGWKEPSTTILMPLYKEALAAEGISGARFPISIRHPLSVAASQVRRQSRVGYREPELTGTHGEPPPVQERTVGLWVHYTLCALRETKGFERQVFSYENFLKEPRPYLERLTKGLMGWQPKESEMDAAVASANPELSHSKFALEDLKSLPPIVASVYDLCLRAEKDPDALNAGNFDKEIDQLWNEWIYTAQMTQPFPLPYLDMFFSWKGGGRASAKYTSSGSWQTIRVPMEPLASTTVQIDPSQLPCQIWIRKAVWRVGEKEIPALIKPGLNGIVEDFGMLRLTIYGPAPAVVQAPAAGGQVELELEFLAVNNYAALIDIIGKVRTRLDHVLRGPSRPGTGGR